MKLLSVTAALHGFHHDVFRCHEGQFFHHSAVYDFIVNDHSVGHVHIYIEYRINCEERFGNRYALVCAVVKRALEPLCSGGESRIEAVDNDISCKCAYTFAAHRIAFVRHCGRADLILFKRLLHFLKRLQNTHIVCEFVRTLRHTGKSREEISINLARIRLTGNGNAFFKAHVLGNKLFQLLHLYLITRKQLHKTRLSSGCAF